MDKEIEQHIINLFLEHQNVVNNKKLSKIDFNESELQKKLGNNHCIPDGLILDNDLGKRTFVEVTTFSKSWRENRFINYSRKGKYENKTIISSPDLGSDRKTILDGFLEIVYKKGKKDYRAFINLVRAQARGILLVRYNNPDPFFDHGAFNNFLSFATDEHILKSLKLEQSCFYKVVFFSHVLGDKGNEKIFKIIWSDKRKKNILM